MGSEKSRYMYRNNRIPAPLNIDELKPYLIDLGAKRLADMMWMSAQWNEVLRRSVMGAIGIQASQDLATAKAAIDYALDLPTDISYQESGYGLILYEIQNTLEGLMEDSVNPVGVLELARYTCDQAEKRIENFQDDWDWVSSLECLQEWLKLKKMEIQTFRK
jgi:hypothetical protein